MGPLLKITRNVFLGLVVSFFFAALAIHGVYESDGLSAKINGEPLPPDPKELEFICLLWAYRFGGAAITAQLLMWLLEKPQPRKNWKGIRVIIEPDDRCPEAPRWRRV